MFLFSRKAKDVSSDINDLIMIHNDRIACYEQALNVSCIDIDLIKAFKNMISETEDFKNELSEFSGRISTHNNVSVSGTLHRAWAELKGGFLGKTRNSIINFCLYNEEIALQSYSTVLNNLKPGNEALKDLLSSQFNQLRANYEFMKSNREARYYPKIRLEHYA